MFAVGDVREDEVETVLDDFVAKARERTAIGFDPRPQIETMMTRALGPEKAENVLARIIPTQDACQIDLLDWLEPGDVASIIEKEHPQVAALLIANLDPAVGAKVLRSEEHTSELQSLMRISYAVFCLKKNNTKKEQ